MSDSEVLDVIQPGQFLDSTEYQSTPQIDNTFKVHIDTHDLSRLPYRTIPDIVVVLVVQRFGVRLVIERSLVRLPAGALSSQLGQLSLPSLRGR